MLLSSDQLLAHAVGDYLLQSDWMAGEKTKKSVAALAHVATYFLPFLFLTRSLPALAVIISTHFIIDRWRLARYVVWAKNFLAPRRTYSQPETTLGGFGFRYEPSVTVVKREVYAWWHPWAECIGTGYHKDRPPFLAVWLLIIADNIIHVTINALALRYL